MSEEQYFKQWQQVITDKGAYTIVEQIGQGNFGRVFKVSEQKSQNFFAMKQVPSSKLQEQLIKDAFQREIEIQKKIDNPNVVKLYDDYYHEPSKSYLLVMRYCQNGDLAQKITKDGYIQERPAINYFKQILNGFLGLHKQGIIHRDIKPSNIYLDKQTAVIGDFGFSRQVEEGELAKSKIGTFSYMAPEMILNQPYNYSVDIYSLGVLLYNMLFGEVPFKAPSGNCVDLVDQIKKGNIDFTLKGLDISKECQTLIKRMLAFETKDRITWKEICQLPFLSSRNLKYPEEKICLAILEGENIDVLSHQQFYEANPQLEKFQPTMDNNSAAKYPSLPPLQKQPNPQDQEKQKLLQQQIQQQVQLQQQKQAQQQQQDILLQQQKVQANIESQKKEDAIFDTGIKKYIHLRNLYGNLIRILNDINTLQEFKINYQITAFLTAKKIIQQIKKLQTILKEKQNIFNIQPFDKFVATKQYEALSTQCDTDLQKMRLQYPKLLIECKESIARLRLTHQPLTNQLATEESDNKFNEIYKESLTNYSFGLKEQCTKDETVGQRNLFCHLIHVSEMVQYESFEKDNFTFDFTQHKKDVRNTPFNQFEKKLDEAFERIFS